MNQKMMVMVISLVAMVFFACHTTDHFDAESVKAEIEAANAKVAEAIANQDAESVAATYAENAMSMPPNHGVLQGREAIRDFFELAFDMGFQGLSSEAIEVQGHGHMVHEIGRFTATIGIADEATIEQKGKYIAIWHKDEDGQWRISRDIWNDDSLPEIEVVHKN